MYFIYLIICFLLFYETYVIYGFSKVNLLHANVIY